MLMVVVPLSGEVESSTQTCSKQRAKIWNRARVQSMSGTANVAFSCFMVSHFQRCRIAEGDGLECCRARRVRFGERGAALGWVGDMVGG